MSLLGTIDDVVAAYRAYLSVAGVFSLNRFNKLLEITPDAAHADAVVYDFLDLSNLEPATLEHPSEGGPDFECHRGDLRVAVEVTSIGEETLTRRSGMSNNPQVGVINFEQLLRAFDGRLSTKSGKPQARVFTGPRVLAIVTKHIVTSVLFAFGIGEFIKSAFTIAEGSSVRTVRRAYAAVLFVQITGDSSLVAGALHPDPEYSLALEVFPRVPFARLKDWQSPNSVVEWVTARPEAFKSLFLPPALRSGASH
jgi:hypothetical protein